MDPNATLEQVRDLYKKKYPSEEEMIALAVLVQSLDEWCTKSGFLPKEWRGRTETADEEQAGRDLAVSRFLDLNLGQWTAWINTLDLDPPPPNEREIVNIVTGLREESKYQLYLQTLLTMSTSTINQYVEQVSKY